MNGLRPLRDLLRACALPLMEHPVSRFLSPADEWHVLGRQRLCNQDRAENAGDGRNDHTKEIAGSEEPDGQLLGISDADDTLLKSN